MSCNCLEFKEKIIDGLYDEAPSDEGADFKRHDESCQECGDLLKGYAALRRHFRQLEILTPDHSSLQRIFTFAETFKAGQKSTLLDSLFGWARGGFALRWAPAMIIVLMATSLTLSVTGRKQGVNRGEDSVAISSFPQNPSQALRDRLLTNPFGEPSGDERHLQGRVPGITNVALEDEPLGADVPAFSLSDLEKIFQQRQKTLLETDADTLLMRGRRLKAMGSVELALKDFETIYYFYPEYSYMSDVLMYRAQCYALLGDKTRARESLEEILKKNPSKKEIVSPLIEQLSK